MRRGEGGTVYSRSSSAARVTSSTMQNNAPMAVAYGKLSFAGWRKAYAAQHAAAAVAALSAACGRRRACLKT